jgi:hypothetical protein
MTFGLSVFKSSEKTTPAIPIAESIKGREIGIFVHPFQKGALDNVEITIGRPMFGQKGELEFKARLRFDAGASSGYQTIMGDNLQDLVNKINSFLEKL